MFFTHVARVVAILGFVFGLMQIGLGFSIALGLVGPREVALARYTTAASSGEVIDKGFLYVGLAIVLGTIAEIGLAVRRARN